MPKKNRLQAADPDRMISFIVPAHNEEDFLRPTLRSIHRAASSVQVRYEIVVVDDASTDATARAAGEEGASVIHVSHRHIAASRDAGARAAAGDVLIFVDADTLVSEVVVRGAIRAFQTGAVGGAALGVFDGKLPLYARALAALWLRIARLRNLTTGCFLFCTRDAYQAAGGFDQTLYVFEDVVFGQQLRRLGRVQLLRETVVTSGRNLRRHSLAEAGRIVVALARHRGGFFRSRDSLGYWYAARQAAPQPNTSQPNEDLKPTASPSSLVE